MHFCFLSGVQWGYTRVIQGVREEMQLVLFMSSLYSASFGLQLYETF